MVMDLPNIFLTVKLTIQVGGKTMALFYLLLELFEDPFAHSTL